MPVVLTAGLYREAVNAYTTCTGCGLEMAFTRSDMSSVYQNYDIFSEGSDFNIE